METSPQFRLIFAVLISSLIAFRSYKRKSLDLSGGIAGFLVMTIHFTAGFRSFLPLLFLLFPDRFDRINSVESERYGALLLVFFLTSSKLTKVGEDKKRRVDVEFKEGGQRNWVQVLCNGGIASVLVVIACSLTGWQDKCLDSKQSETVTALIGGIIGHYACCNGDTWSSELGVLSDAQPRLITTLKPVKKGTNGGVTKAGLLAALAAGTTVGVTFLIFGFFTARCATDVAIKQLLAIPVSALAGLCGSLIDSVLGATIQFSGFCSVRNKVVGRPGPTVKKISGVDILDNNGVNFVSIFLTSFLTSIASVYIF